MHDLSPRFGDERTHHGVREMYVGNGRWVNRAVWRSGFAYAMQRSPHRTYGVPPRLSAHDLKCLMAEPRHPRYQREIERA